MPKSRDLSTLSPFLLGFLPLLFVASPASGGDPCDLGALQLIVNQAQDQMVAGLRGGLLSPAGAGLVDPMPRIGSYFSALNNLRSCQKAGGIQASSCVMPERASAIDDKLQFGFHQVFENEEGNCVAGASLDIRMGFVPLAVFNNGSWFLPRQDFQSCSNPAGPPGPPGMSVTARSALLVGGQGTIRIDDGLTPGSQVIPVGAGSKTVLGVRVLPDKVVLRFNWTSGVAGGRSLGTVDIDLGSGKVSQSTILDPALYSDNCKSSDNAGNTASVAKKLSTDP